ncbi:DUF4097 family beta strand repeat-containing protein [Halococcus salsus]|uniref:DUF4097 family beta strand repeat-containing protein n=1 Tax=Halococcus salsus TaxID=2162894 RepID=UPI001359F9BA|nr:DUF4097 family beta strand repeat-containing protein [Halococcus salsus]
MTSDDGSAVTLSRRRLLGGCAVGLGAFSAGCSGATPFVGKREEFDRTLGMTEGRLTLETDSGAASVRRADADRVRLHGVKESGSVFTDLEDMTVETARNGDHLAVSGDSGGDSWFGLGGGSISLDAAVPSGIRVEAVTAKNGDATATGVVGDVALRSTNGTVAARNVDGFVSLSSTNGPVRARRVRGIAGAETTNGDVDVHVPRIDGHVSLSLTNGQITAALAPNLDARVTATTTNGNITTTGLPLDATGSDRNSLTGTIGTGTNRLTVRTTNGSIKLTRLG